MKIIVDAMGGDNAPQAIVQGALDAHKAYGVEILLVGRAAEVLRAVEACGEKTLPAGVEIWMPARWWRLPTIPLPPSR